MSDRSTYDDSEIEIGIVGLGTHGANHAEILADLGHEVVGVDADPQTRREFQGRYDATTYESLPDLFGTDIGAVVMTTPIKFHEPTAMEAFDADIDVFVEKPLAHSLESAERIAAMACDNFREILFAIHTSRYDTRSATSLGSSRSTRPPPSGPASPTIARRLQ